MAKNSAHVKHDKNVEEFLFKGKHLEKIRSKKFREKLEKYLSDVWEKAYKKKARQGLASPADKRAEDGGGKATQEGPREHFRASAVRDASVLQAREKKPVVEKVERNGRVQNEEADWSYDAGNCSLKTPRFSRKHSDVPNNLNMSIN